MTPSLLAEPNLLEDLNIRCDRHVPLGPLTWYGVGGAAAVLARPSSVHQLSAMAARCHDVGWPVYVLGSGANLLVSDAGIQGVVTRLDDPAFKQIKTQGHTVTVGSGFDLAKLVLQTAKDGLAGLEGLAGIPASVGGAVRMNAGGAFGQIGQAVRRVMVCDATGQIYYRDREDLVFGYRQTNITAPYILEVEFELTPADPQSLTDRVKEIFRFKKRSQPLTQHSAGCAFKNPVQPQGMATTTDFPNANDTMPRIPAGQLIEGAGLKGFRIGGAEVSTQHANFIIAHPTCTASDILAVLDHIQETVAKQTGIHLEREVVVWP